MPDALPRKLSLLDGSIRSSRSLSRPCRSFGKNSRKLKPLLVSPGCKAFCPYTDLCLFPLAAARRREAAPKENAAPVSTIRSQVAKSVGEDAAITALVERLDAERIEYLGRILKLENNGQRLEARVAELEERVEDLKAQLTEKNSDGAEKEVAQDEIAPVVNGEEPVVT